MNLYFPIFIGLWGASIWLDKSRSRYYVHTKKLMAPGFGYAVFTEMAMVPVIYMMMLDWAAPLIGIYIDIALCITLIGEFSFFSLQSWHRQRMGVLP